MKKQHLLATLLALIMMVSVFPATASAYYRESVSINVDGQFISDVDAYLDSDNNVLVSTGEDLLKIFPRIKDVIAYVPGEGILVEEYVDDLGYESHLRVSYDNGKYFYYTLYIYTDSETDNNKPGNNWPDSSSQYAEVYINGVYTPMYYPYQYWSIDFSDYQTAIFSGNRIYLNNDGNSPVEVVVDGKLIGFPDQQPIVLTPGRTMVPVRTIAEMLNFKVEWDSKLNCAIISRGKDTMMIYSGSTSYLFNGKYYTMDVEPTVLNGRTLVPLRFVAEAFGYTVDFKSGDVLTVYLTSRK